MYNFYDPFVKTKVSDLSTVVKLAQKEKKKKCVSCNPCIVQKSYISEFKH